MSKFPAWGRNLQLPVLVFAIVIAAVIAIFFYYDTVTERTISIRARTQQVSVQFEARTDWMLPYSVLCEATPPSRTRRQDEHSGREVPCGDTERKLGEGPLSMTWPNGSGAVIRRSGTGPMEILLAEPDPETAMPQPGISIASAAQRILGNDRLRIVIPLKETTMIGSLRLAGPLIIGDEPVSPDILLDGQYEIREPLYRRDEKLTTDTGALVLGDTVTIVDEEHNPFPVSGFLTIADHGASGFDVVAVNGEREGNGELPKLKLERVGYQPAYLTPHWTKRAVADKAFVVLAAVAAAIAAAFTIAGETVSIATQARARRVTVVPAPNREDATGHAEEK